MKILGISAFYHDSAACLVVDGDIIAAAQEERFTRNKHDASFPKNAINYCVQEQGLKSSDIDIVVFYDKPILKFERLLETYLAFAPRGFKNFFTSLPVWLKDKLFQKSLIVRELEALLDAKIDWSSRLYFSEHHFSHAASAFYPSPFSEAAVLTMDGVGEWATTSLAIGKGSELTVLKEIRFPHSLGLLYSAMTYFTGFKVNSGEYKVMGLAPYGEPRFVDSIKKNLIAIKEDGSFHLNMRYFGYCTGLRMTNKHFDKLFDGGPRQPESELTQREMDLAASIQAVTEEVVLKLTRGIANTTGSRNLCLAGGVALNCVANGKLIREKIFDNVWVQPASGDAGGAIGAALAVFHAMHKGKRRIKESDAMQGSYLGPEFAQATIENKITEKGGIFTTLSDHELFQTVAKLLAEGKSVGWHQGRMEFGPRALGNRSILADPRSVEMQKELNLKIKFRESFRPFAPAVLRDEVSDWFEFDSDSPYMVFVAEVAKSRRQPMSESQQALFGIDKLNVKRSEIPAVTHVDYSARIQTIHQETNPRFHALARSFFELTGCPVLVNTSFNIRGEPIVCTPDDAFRCFMGTGLDVLVVGNSILLKCNQDADLVSNYSNEYELD